jgi:hypothetical protein
MTRRGTLPVQQVRTVNLAHPVATMTAAGAMVEAVDPMAGSSSAPEAMRVRALTEVLQAMTNTMATSVNLAPTRIWAACAFASLATKVRPAVNPIRCAPALMHWADAGAIVAAIAMAAVDRKAGVGATAPVAARLIPCAPVSDACANPPVVQVKRLGCPASG